MEGGVGAATTTHSDKGKCSGRGRNTTTPWEREGGRKGADDRQVEGGGKGGEGSGARKQQRGNGARGWARKESYAGEPMGWAGK